MRATLPRAMTPLSGVRLCDQPLDVPKLLVPILANRGDQAHYFLCRRSVEQRLASCI
jgi:hypothetical protein